MKLIDVINEIANLPNEDKVNIRGKFYTTVDTRLQCFRKVFGSDAKVTTDIIINDLDTSKDSYYNYNYNYNYSTRYYNRT